MQDRKKLKNSVKIKAIPENNWNSATSQLNQQMVLNKLTQVRPWELINNERPENKILEL